MSLGLMPKSAIAGPHDQSIFSFKRNCQLFSRVAVLFYMPTGNVGEIQFLHILLSIRCLLLALFFFYSSKRLVCDSLRSSLFY